jgi:hypothetical protein|uniref:Uncharacterized protein n=1 Tax=Bionectria ochroleuca TaxID=29856 RepID=A0A8H7TQ40_BIOOC
MTQDTNETWNETKMLISTSNPTNEFCVSFGNATQPRYHVVFVDREYGNDPPVTSVQLRQSEAAPSVWCSETRCPNERLHGTWELSSKLSNLYRYDISLISLKGPRCKSHARVARDAVGYKPDIGHRSVLLCAAISCTGNCALACE